MADEQGRLRPHAFFLGEYSDKGWLLYFPVAFLIKTPVPSILLIAASLLLCRAGTPLRLRNALFLLLPVGIILALMVPAKINIGVRYLTPIYPFLFVCAARLATLRFPRPWLAPVLLGVPVLLTAASSLRRRRTISPTSTRPIGGPDHGDRYLADTNIDWGQDLKGLKEYMDRERDLTMVYLSYFGTAPPEEYGIRYQETAQLRRRGMAAAAHRRVPRRRPRKVLAVSVTNLQGAYLGEPGPYEFFYRAPNAAGEDRLLDLDLRPDRRRRGPASPDRRVPLCRRARAEGRGLVRGSGGTQVAELHQQLARQWDGLTAEE